MQRFELEIKNKFISFHSFRMMGKEEFELRLSGYQDISINICREHWPHWVDFPFNTLILFKLKIILKALFDIEVVLNGTIFRSVKDFLVHASN